MEETNSVPFSPLSYLISVYSAVCGYFSRFFLRILAVGAIPKHIAIIMDGNRRYADRSQIDRTRGHLYGYDRLISTLENCFELGVKYVTVYAFSIDNFRRPADEVHALMNLMEEKLDHLCDSNRLTKEFGVRVQVLGDLSLLPGNVRAAAERAMVATRQNNSVVLNVCVAYTSTAEIVHSIQEIRDKFLGTLTHALPSITDKSSTCSYCIESEVENWNGTIKAKLDARNGGPNGYHDGSGFSALCSKSDSEQLEASNDYSALCFQGKKRLLKNGFFHEQILEPNFPILEMGGNSGEELGNGVMTEHTGADLQLPTCEVTQESDNAGNQKVPPLNLDFITVKEIENHLYTAGCPPPELLIRTSGETRLSNFMLWQCSSSHLSFCKVLWPEFSLRHLAWIILDYQRSAAELEKHRIFEEDLLSRSVSCNQFSQS